MFVRKITIKSVCGANPDIIAVKSAPKGGLHVVRVAGRVDRVISRESQYGEEVDGKKLSRGLAGNFRAICIATGEVFDSTRAFLPGIVQENIEHALAGIDAGSNPDGAVEFGVDIYAVISDRDANKYEFRVKPFKAIETHSPVQDLLELAPPLPALAGPSRAEPAGRKASRERSGARK